jgi:hypothetical protein
MSESSPRYIYDYMAEMFFGKTLHHRYITYYEKLKGYGRGLKSQDFDKFNLKAWAIVPISNNEKLDMSVYCLKIMKSKILGCNIELFWIKDF